MRASAAQMMLVMEYMAGGDLARALNRDCRGAREYGWYGKGRFILLGIARGLAFIHAQKVIHLTVVITCKRLVATSTSFYCLFPVDI